MNLTNSIITAIHTIIKISSISIVDIPAATSDSKSIFKFPLNEYIDCDKELDILTAISVSISLIKPSICFRLQIKMSEPKKRTINSIKSFF